MTLARSLPPSLLESVQVLQPETSCLSQVFQEDKIKNILSSRTSNWQRLIGGLNPPRSTGLRSVQGSHIVPAFAF